MYMLTTLLRIAAVSKQYGDYKALDAVSLDVHSGEILSLLGVNGAGKTTLSSIVATLKPPTSGDLIFFGKSVQNGSVHNESVSGESVYQDIIGYRTNIGFCPQKPNLNNYLSLRENLQFAGRYYNLPEDFIDARIAELAQKFNFGRYLDQRPDILSGGYKQRFMLARSVLHNPKLVILDEPTVALDPHIRRELWDYILHLKQNNIAVLLTTHYLDEAEVLSDRVCVLDKGKVRLIDTPKNLMSSFNKGRLEEVFIDLMQEETKV